LLTLASLVSGIAAASENILHNRYSKLDQYALEQASKYFDERSDDAGREKSPTSMAAMGAARHIATLQTPQVHIGDEGKFFKQLSRDLKLLAENPNERRDLAEAFDNAYSALADGLRAEARSLLYRDLNRPSGQ
jgi:hypothetical protein